jgi:quinoprotein glucose dehydrogenase
MRLAALLTCAAPALLAAQTSRAPMNVDWPVFGGTTDNTHYSTLSQITPANVAQLRVAWTYATHDEFKGSEMQTNPVVIDGVLYGTSPKLRVFALDAATGRELWSFDPNFGRPAPSRFRHRGLVVTGDRVLVTYRYKLYALDRKTGRPIPSFGDSSGYADMRNAFDRPRESITISASTPGVVYRDLYIIGSTVPEALPACSR